MYAKSLYIIVELKSEQLYGNSTANKIDFSTMPRGYKTPKLSNCKRITARSTVMTQVKVV